jgi:hypothetical protein
MEKFLKNYNKFKSFLNNLYVRDNKTPSKIISQTQRGMVFNNPNFKK